MKTEIEVNQNDVASKSVVDEEPVKILNCTDFIIHNTKCHSILFTVWQGCDVLTFLIFDSKLNLKC